MMPISFSIKRMTYTLIDVRNIDQRFQMIVSDGKLSRTIDMGAFDQCHSLRLIHNKMSNIKYIFMFYDIISIVGIHIINKTYPVQRPTTKSLVDRCSYEPY